MEVEKITDIYGLALFGIWTALLAAVWVHILYDRHKNQNGVRQEKRENGRTSEMSARLMPASGPRGIRCLPTGATTTPLGAYGANCTDD